MTLTPDVTIADRYVLEERVAIGGMGEVWRARDVVLDRRVAVKVLRDAYAADPAFLDRFRSEARHTASLSHPGIANVFDYGEVGSMAYLVMEYVDGEPLSALLARTGRLSPARTLDVVGQAGLALQAAHDAGVVHRDVKPGNLLVRPDGVVKVTDFGIARAVDAAPVTQTGMVVGTAAYLSPEQAAGQAVTPSSDVYALGVVAYECLAGERPFEGDSAVATATAHVSAPVPPLPKDVPPIVADLVTAMLAKEPDRRPASAGEAGRTALALAATLRNSPNDTRLMTAAVPAPPRDKPDAAFDAQKRRVRNVFIAVGAAVVVLGFLLLHSCTGGAQQVTMPTVTDRSFSAAAALLHQRGLNATQRTLHDAQHKAGTVIAQSVSPGTTIGDGSTVVLTVASGPRAVHVVAGDYVGKPAAQVATTLQTEGLGVRTTAVPTQGVQPGTVVALSPTGTLHEGEVVTLTVAAKSDHGNGGDNGNGNGGGGGGD